MNLFKRLVDSLDALAVSIQILAKAYITPAPPSDETIEQTKYMKILSEQNAIVMQRRAEWETVEREHMKVCEQRYRRLQAGESMADEPKMVVRH